MSEPGPGAPPPGLCGVCRHRRWIPSRRGSWFLLCGRAASDPRFVRYPHLPVFACPGFEPDGAAEGDQSAAR